MKKYKYPGALATFSVIVKRQTLSFRGCYCKAVTSRP